MRGLLIKDAYTMIKETKLFLIFAVIISFIQNDFLFSYAIFYSAMLPLTALSYDERSKWNKLADMLPYSAKDIVGSKYIIGYLCVFCMSFLVFCGKILFTGLNHPMPGAEDWMVLLGVACASTIIQSVNLPFMFWIGVERGRYLFILFSVTAIIASLTCLEHMDLARIQITPGVLLSGILTFTIVCNLISFLVSKRIYQKKS